MSQPFLSLPNEPMDKMVIVAEIGVMHGLDNMGFHSPRPNCWPDLPTVETTLNPRYGMGTAISTRNSQIKKPAQLFDSVPAQLSQMLQSWSCCLSLSVLVSGCRILEGLSTLQLILCLSPEKLCLNTIRKVLNILPLAGKQPYLALKLFLMPWRLW